MGSKKETYGPDNLTLGQVLRRAGYAPSSEILFPPQEDDPPADDLLETWIPMFASTDGIVKDSILPYNHDPRKVAVALTTELEEIPRALALETHSMVKAILQARLEGLL